jgi:hypothetical protein
LGTLNLTVFVIVPAPGACTLEDGLVGTCTSNFFSSFKFLLKVSAFGACTLLLGSVLPSDGTSDAESKP